MNFLYGTYMQYRSSIWFLYVFLMVGIQYIHIYILFYMVTMQSFEKNQLQHLYRFFIRYPYCNIENPYSSYQTTILTQKIYMDDINIFFKSLYSIHMFIQKIQMVPKCTPYSQLLGYINIYLFVYAYICVCKQIYICVTSEKFFVAPPPPWENPGYAPEC